MKKNIMMLTFLAIVSSGVKGMDAGKVDYTRDPGVVKPGTTGLPLEELETAVADVMNLDQSQLLDVVTKVDDTALLQVITASNQPVEKVANASALLTLKFLYTVQQAANKFFSAQLFLYEIMNF